MQTEKVSWALAHLQFGMSKPFSLTIQVQVIERERRDKVEYGNPVVTLDDVEIAAPFKMGDVQTVIELPSGIVIDAGQTLKISNT